MHYTSLYLLPFILILRSGSSVHSTLNGYPATATNPLLTFPILPFPVSPELSSSYIAAGGAGSSELPAFLRGRLTIPHAINVKIANPTR